MIAEMFQLSMNSVLFFTGAIVGAVLLAVWGNKADEKAWNIYAMTYDSLRRCDCGSLEHPEFSQQINAEAVKQRLLHHRPLTHHQSVSAWLQKHWSRRRAEHNQ